MLVLTLLSACGGGAPSDDQVFDIARNQLRAGLASQVGMKPDRPDTTLDEAIKKSEFSMAEPCQSHPQMPQVYACAVKVRVSLPLPISEGEKEVTMPVLIVKSKNGSWVDGMQCGGDLTPDC
jgi:hypothetical protein